MVFYFDASVPIDVARALALVRDDIVYPGGPGCEIKSPGAKDVEWLPIAGRNGWIVVMRDKKIRVRHHEREALLEAGVRAFCFTGGGNYSKWQLLDLFVRQVDAMTRVAAEPGPYICSVTQAGVRRLFPQSS